MCRIATPQEERVACSRCGEVANPNDGWEHEWPNTGYFKIYLDSCAQEAFGGWEHPLVKVSGQTIEAQWGYSLFNDDPRTKPTPNWRMCRHCQRELILTLGRFFRTSSRPLLDKQVEGSVYSSWYHTKKIGAPIDG